MDRGSTVFQFDLKISSSDMNWVQIIQWQASGVNDSSCSIKRNSLM
jgi:hypothetical protein